MEMNRKIADHRHACAGKILGRMEQRAQESIILVGQATRIAQRLSALALDNERDSNALSIDWCDLLAFVHIKEADAAVMLTRNGDAMAGRILGRKT